MDSICHGKLFGFVVSVKWKKISIIFYQVIYKLMIEEGWWYEFGFVVSVRLRKLSIIFIKKEINI